MADITNFDNGIGEAISPEEWSSYVLDHLAHESVVLASGATRIDTSAKQVHVPRLTSDGGAGWFAELEEIDVGDPVGDDLVLTPHKCAAVTVLSNEVVADSNPSVLDAVGGAMTRAVALAADKALFVGGGTVSAPAGFVNHGGTVSPLQTVAGSITYANVVRAGGSIAAYGGRADSLYVNPSDYTTLQLAVGGDDRPLIQPDASQGGAATIAGFRVYPTPALGAGTALVAQASQLVVALRSDASVDFSTDALFEKDATVARVVARVDGDVADPNGVCLIHA